MLMGKSLTKGKWGPMERILNLKKIITFLK